MARLPYPDLDHAAPELRELVLRLKSAHVFHMLAHAGAALRPFVQLGSALLFKGRLDPRLRELAILRVGHLCAAPYEVQQHEMVAREIGVPEAQIAASATGAEAPDYDAEQRAVLRYTDALTRQVRVDDASFAALRAHLDDGQVVELTLAVAYYGMVARVLEALQIELESEQKLSGMPRSAAGGGA